VRRALPPLLRVAVLACVAAPALAAGEAHDAEASGAGFIWHVVNFLLLVGVLVALVRKPARKFFAERRAQIHEDLNGAASLLKRAESRYAEWQRKLVDLDAELERIRAAARERAAAERERILSEARDAAERIQLEARASVDQELRRARGRLREEAADLAAKIATDLLREQVTDRDRERLTDEFIARVDEGA
jgi:F-type H+-transporting ATPase subunit b